MIIVKVYLPYLLLDQFIVDVCDRHAHVYVMNYGPKHTSDAG